MNRALTRQLLLNGSGLWGETAANGIHSYRGRKNFSDLMRVWPIQHEVPARRRRPSPSRLR